MLERKIKPIAVAVGTVFAAALAAAAIAESDNALFAVDELDRGYDRVADAHLEGGCGEDRDTSGDKEEGSCGEGSCGEGEGEGEKEGSCGEGKCGEGEHEDEAEESADA